ncbi:MAG: polysaccharide biosynthesis C-terminal domain-containing protein, partial [Chloroflexi bacterium]|nr:polysaccharide biosynthesis C-terminal domain-containing protein [Chloroflexota bacterium]
WLMGPRMLGLAAGQLNFLVSTVLASGLSEGSLTAYNYAFQLSQIPVGVIGVSIAVAMFPTLSHDAALGNVGRIRSQVSNAVRILVYIALPLTAMSIVLREPVTAVFYQYGAFTADASARTASALAFFAIGLTGHIVVHVLTRAFYAMQDTRTPVRWAIVAVAINVPLMVLLVGPMGIEGLALALSISAVAEVIGLLWSLQRRIESIEAREILRSGARAAVGAIAAALAMLGGLRMAEAIVPAMLDNVVGRLVVLAVLVLVGAGIHAAVTAALGSPELRQLRHIRRHVGRGAA